MNKDFDAEYLELTKKGNLPNNVFIWLTTCNSTYVECENILFESSQEGSPEEILAVELVQNLKYITRMEYYIISGLSLNLIDTLLENLRSEGYLEYIFPFNLEIMDKNIKELKLNLSLTLDVESQLELQLKKEEFKQYKITDKGKILAKTSKKDSRLNGNLEFLFLRRENWESIAQCSKINYFNKSSITEIDFPVIEKFLSENKGIISKNRVFNQLQQSSKLSYIEEETILYVVEADNQLFFHKSNAGTNSIHLINSFNIDLDLEGIKRIFMKEIIKNEIISLTNNITDCQLNGISFFWEIKEIDEISLLFQRYPDFLKS